MTCTALKYYKLNGLKVESQLMERYRYNQNCLMVNRD